MFSIAFTPDSQLLAVGGNIPNLRVFRVNDGTVARTLFGSGVSVQSLAISSDGQLLAAGNSGSRSNSTRRWTERSVAAPLDELL